MTALEEISRIADIPIDVTVELDRKVMSIREILSLRRSSVITMTRSAGENIDILAGGSVLGFGEIVIIENTMGVRITDFNEEE